MARTYDIEEIIQSTLGVPGRICLVPSEGNRTSVFKGKYYKNSSGTVLPGYTASVSVPTGYVLIKATSFEIQENPTYNGTYTVYSKVSAGDSNNESMFGTRTEISVAEIVLPTGTSDNLNTGKVTNVSSFLLSIAGEFDLLVEPRDRVQTRPISFVGRDTTSWGESYTQNLIDITQNFASDVPPPLPLLGQTWFSPTTGEFSVRTSSAWSTISTTAPGVNTTYRFTQTTSSTTWTVNHNLNLVSPFVALTQVFVDVGGGVHKMILPDDVNFLDANTTVITFTTPRTGVVLMRV